MSRSLYLGRTPERAIVAAALTGPGRVVLLSGEAGAGKTSMVRAALADAEAQPTAPGQVVSAACLQLAGQPLPLAAVEELLDQRGGWPVATGPELSAASAVERAAAIGRWADVLAPRHATAWTAVVVDDLQWADETTCDLLLYLVATAARRSLSLVVTLRDDGGPLRPHVRQTWLDLARAEGSRRIVLNGLGVDDCRALAEALHRELGRPAPTAAQVSSLVARSGGNPYLLTEMVSGPDDPHVRDLFGDRLRSLSTSALALVRQAAVLGEWVEDRLLRAAVDLPAGNASDLVFAAGVREAVDAGVLVVRDDGYSFRHGLAHEAVLAALLPIESRTLHRRAAAALETAPDHAAAVAAGGGVATADVLLLAARSAHLQAAGDRTAAAGAALAAARGLMALAAYGEAWAHYRVVLATPTDNDPLPLALEAAEAARLAGEPGGAADVLAAAMSTAPADSSGQVLAAALERIALYRWEAGRPNEAMAAFEAADAALGPGLTPVHAQVWAGRARAAFIMARFAEAVRDADRAVAAARAVAPGAVLADALVTRGTAAVILGDTAGLALLLEGVDLARAGDDAGVLCRAYSNLIVAYEYTGRADLAVDTSLEGLRLLPEHGLELPVGAALACNATNMLIRRGRYAECAEILDDLLVGRAVRGQALHLYIERAALQLAMGDVNGARTSLAASTPLLAADEPAILVAIAETTAECFRQEQDYPNCHATVIEALERTDDAHYRSALALIGLRAEADRPGPRADPDAVGRRERLLAAFVPLPADGAGGPDRDVNLDAERLTALAEAGRAAGDDDPDRWTPAVSLWREAERPHDEAWCLIRQAQAYVDRRDRAAATDAVARGREIATGLPAAPLVALADALIRRARLVLPDAAVYEAPPVGVAATHGLTAREIDVLDLLGDGSTNREIAQRLFISERTVGVHVTNLLRKLGAANRTQAAAFAARTPVAPSADTRRT